MTLKTARCKFSKALAELVLYAYSIGYEVCFDEVTERITQKDPTSDHMKNSLHHLGLAGDLNLYKNGVYLETTEDHKPLGDWWEKKGVDEDIPLRWGGRFSKPDGNHYELNL
jgi:hypothetical protein